MPQFKKSVKISWDEFKSDCRRLADAIVVNDMSDAVFLAIANGGLFAAAMLGRILKNDNIVILGAKRKEENGKTDVDITSSFLCRHFLERTNYKLLLIDDVYDSGKTIAEIHKHLIRNSVVLNKELTIRYATPYYKIGTKIISSYERHPSLISVSAINHMYWMVYPWENQPES